MSALHVYATFDHRTGDLVAISRSVVGAGTAALGHVGPIVFKDGRPIDIDAITEALLLEPHVVLYGGSDRSLEIRIERHFLGP